eukprot:2387625-Pleurochrysis_carterae.AAC.1
MERTFVQDCDVARFAASALPFSPKCNADDVMQAKHTAYASRKLHSRRQITRTSSYQGSGTKVKKQVKHGARPRSDSRSVCALTRAECFYACRFLLLIEGVGIRAGVRTHAKQLA